MADTKAQRKVTITHGNIDEIQINTGVFFVTRIQVDPALHGNYTRFTIHYAREPEEMREGKQQKQTFLLRDDLANALAEALEYCVAENIAKDAISRANRLKQPN
jgi:hypothetical protein